MRRPSRPPSMAGGALLLTIVLAGACTPEPEPGPSPGAPAVPASETAMTWPDPDSAVAWQSWGPAAFDAARARDVQVLLYVSGPGCGGLFAADEGVAAWNAETRFLPVRIDPERQPHVARRYAPAGCPSISVLDSAGREVVRATDIPADNVTRLLTRIHHHRRRDPSRLRVPPPPADRPPPPALGGARPCGRGLRLRRAFRRFRPNPQVPRAAGDRLPPGLGEPQGRSRGRADGAPHPRRAAGQPPVDPAGCPELLPHARLEDAAPGDERRRAGRPAEGAGRLRFLRPPPGGRGPCSRSCAATGTTRTEASSTLGGCALPTAGGGRIPRSTAGTTCC